MPISVNILTDAVILECPPRLILINRCGYFTMTASVNVLTEVVAGLAAQPRTNVVQKKNYSSDKLFCNVFYQAVKKQGPSCVELYKSY